MLLKPDGSLNPGWHKTVGLPDSFGKFTTFEGLVKSHASLERMLGGEKITLPGPNATAEDKAAFYERLGRPSKPEDYGIKMPDKLPDGKPFPKELWSDERAGSFAKVAHDIGLSKDQVAALTKFDTETGLKTAESIQQAQQAAQEAATKALKAEWGSRFDEQLKLAQRAAKEAGGDDLLGHPLANDPTFIKAMAKVGAMIVEDGAAGARGTTHSGVNPQAEINAIRGDKAHPYHHKNHPGHADAVARVQELYKLKHGEAS